MRKTSQDVPKMSEDLDAVAPFGSSSGPRAATLRWANVLIVPNRTEKHNGNSVRRRNTLLTVLRNDY
jgi:hypothetical protein